MIGPILSGANLYKTVTTLNVADIQSLDGAAAIELAAGVTGKTICPIALLGQFNYGGSAWTLGGSAAAYAFWGNVNTGVKINATEILAALIGTVTASQLENIHPPFQATAVEPLASLQGLGIYLIETHNGFNVAGSGTVEFTLIYALV
jgi:hypothetical protein